MSKTIAEATAEFRSADQAAQGFSRSGPHGITQARVTLGEWGDRVRVQVGGVSITILESEAYQLAQDLIRASEVALRVDRAKRNLYVVSRRERGDAS